MLRILEKIFGDRYDRHMRKPNKFYRNPVSEECWNLDLAFVDFMIPRLELFKKEASEIIVYDWNIVDEILEGFRMWQDHFEWTGTTEELKAKIAKVQHSMELFAEHWMEFGW